MKQTKIILTGEGGQGIQTIAKIITEAAAEEGYEVSYIPAFGVEQRGTPSVAFITIGHDHIYYPRFDKADYAIILQSRAINSVRNYISHDTKVIFDSSTVSKADLPQLHEHFFGLPATKFASENLKPKVFNIIMTGKLAAVLGLNREKVWTVIERILGKKFKTDQIRQMNLQAFEIGQKAVFEVSEFTKPTYVPGEGKIISKGHERRAEIIPERCKGCGICIHKCPVGALKFSDTLGIYATPIPEIDLEKCIACGNCLRFCPDGAIIAEKKKK